MHINRDFSTHDIDVLQRQLRSKNVHIAGILQRCPHGYPAIVILNPENTEKDGENHQKELNFTSISTPLWLTCPHLNDRIHILESGGFVKKIEKYMQNDSEMSSFMIRAHVHYAILRKNIYKQFSRYSPLVEKYGDVFNAGIGGIREKSSVKCLHLHVAHFAACEDNVVGKITLDLLEGDKFCKEVKCENVFNNERSYSYQAG